VTTELFTKKNPFSELKYWLQCQTFKNSWCYGVRAWRFAMQSTSLSRALH